MPQIQKTTAVLANVSLEPAPKLIAGASGSQTVVVKGKKVPTKVATEKAERTEAAAQKGVKKLARSSSVVEAFVPKEEEQERTHRRHQPARAAKVITNRKLVMTAEYESGENSQKTKPKTAETAAKAQELAALPAEAIASKAGDAHGFDNGKEVITKVLNEDLEEVEPRTAADAQIPVTVEKQPEAHRACCTKRSVALVASAVVLATSAVLRLWTCYDEPLAMKLWC